jgi:ribonucleotide monophosphatase NagD (HAD superfamily)
MEMGRRAGAVTILVLSGETTAEMVEAATEPPDFVMSDLDALGSALRGGARRELVV